MDYIYNNRKAVAKKMYGTEIKACILFSLLI